MEQELEVILTQAREGGSDHGGFDALIPLLQKVQKALGYISEKAIFAIGEATGVPSARVFGVLTFYGQFRTQPQGRNVIKVCRGTACHVRGGPQVLRAVEDRLGISSGETTPDGKFTLEQIACFGSCSLAPVMVVNENVYGRLTPDKALQLLEGYRENEQDS